MFDLTPAKALIFRITHINNVGWILANGLHARSTGVLDPAFVQIGNPDVIDRRAGRHVPVPPGGTLDDYVPFYFTPASPMLFNIKTGQGVARLPMTEIVVLVSSVHLLREHGVRHVITDRHALLQAAEFSNDRAALERLDWPRLRSRDFRRDPNDPVKVERYQADALAYRHVPSTALVGVGCVDRDTETRLAELVHNAGTALPCVVRPQWFFS